MSHFARPTFALCQRELVRFLRQRNRVIGAFATPIVFWLLIGGGMGRSFVAPGADGYLGYFFPGTILMILLFTAIFSTISVIEDRREGFLQGVLVAPVGRGAIVAGKVLGGTILATGQAMLFLLLGWITGVVSLSIATSIATIGAMCVISVGLTALGLCIAWPMSSTQGFHAIMNLFLMPMWMLSGALFPIRDDSPRILRAVMLANPLHWGLDLLRKLMAPVAPVLRDIVPSLAITAVFAAGMVCLAILIARRRIANDLV
ncbi:MAG: ABC transporter permease [Burkholderiales bacterium]|nr:ABC transporter permease [Phycisphaerae bacterium]